MKGERAGHWKFGRVIEYNRTLGEKPTYKYTQDNVPRGAKMPSFKCIAKNCPFETSAPTEAELMKKIVEHAKTVHNMDPMPPDIMAKVKAAIKP